MLNDSKLNEAVSLFEQTLALDPTYVIPRDNLAIVHNRLGLAQTNPTDALKHFHTARILNNEQSLENIEKKITELGKDPINFWDRLKLGNDAYFQKDFIGAYVEYSAALKLKSDKTIQMRRTKIAGILLKRYPYLVNCVEVAKSGIARPKTTVKIHPTQKRTNAKSWWRQGLFNPSEEAVKKIYSESTLSKLKLNHQKDRETATAAAESFEIQGQFSKAKALYERIVSEMKANPTCDAGNLSSYMQSIERTNAFIAVDSEVSGTTLAHLTLWSLEVLSKPQFIRETTYKSLHDFLVQKLPSSTTQLVAFRKRLNENKNISDELKASFNSKLLNRREN